MKRARHTAAPIEQRLGPELKRLREAGGISLRLLADRAGFSASFISQVENGQASPSIASLEKIAATLGVTLAGSVCHSHFAGGAPGSSGRATELPKLMVTRTDRLRDASR